jgi:hypothetical protein
MSDQVNVTYWGFRCENASAAPPFRRHFRRVIDVLTAEGSDRFAAELIFGELVGNVVRHSPGPIEVRLEFSDRTTILSVTDEGQRPRLVPRPCAGLADGDQAPPRAREDDLRRTRLTPRRLSKLPEIPGKPLTGWFPQR